MPVGRDRAVSSRGETVLFPLVGTRDVFIAAVKRRQKYARRFKRLKLNAVDKLNLDGLD
jgi:hypothetical protein